MFVIWLALLSTGGIFLAPHSIGLYVVYATVLGIALFVVALIKGEKPRWRWGKEQVTGRKREMGEFSKG